MSNYMDQSVNLTINRVSRSKYRELSSAGQILSNEIYLIKDQRLDGSGLRAINIASPQISSDASNKMYVDDNASKVSFTDPSLGISNVKGDLKVQKVSLDEYRQILDTHTQQEISNYIFIVSSDNIDAFNQRVTNVANPLSSNDAATKSYVDTHVPEINVATSSRAGIVKPDNTTISVSNDGTITSIGGGSSISKIETYYPAFQSNQYILKPYKLNILSSVVPNNCQIILENYDQDAPYYIKLSSDTSRLCQINLLKDIDLGDGIQGAVPSELTSQFKYLSPNQIYSVKIEHGNVNINEDSTAYGIRNAKPILISDGYEYTDYYYNVYPVANSLNNMSLPSTYTNPTKYSVIIPQQIYINGNRKSRDFTLRFTGNPSPATIEFYSYDVSGQSIQYVINENEDIDDYRNIDSSNFYLTFTEISQNVFMLGKNLLKSLS